MCPYGGARGCAPSEVEGQNPPKYFSYFLLKNNPSLRLRDHRLKCVVMYIVRFNEKGVSV